MRLLLLFSLLAIPTVTQAAVKIAEVAWMGGVDSANHEWIELHNDGEVVDVSGWRLVDNANLEITLSGTVEAGERVVLERTSEDSAPGSAFLVYAGALVNSGSVLTLRDAQGSVIDQVVGGDGWQNIGGDNSSKATAQLLNGSWVTAPGTPGFATSAIEEVVVATGSDDNLVTVTDAVSNSLPLVVASGRSGSGESITLTLPDVTLQLLTQAPGYVHVNEPVTYTAIASGIGDTLLDSLEYVWNFGDGTTGVGPVVSHAYQYPGRYVVVLQSGYKRQQQMTRFEIDVVEPVISIEQLDRAVEVVNEGDREINLGGYVVSGVANFKFPEYSILLPRQSIVLSDVKTVRTDRSSMVTLHDQSGRVVARDVHLAAQPVTVPAPRGQDVLSIASMVPLAVAQTETVSSVYSSADAVNVDSQRFGFASEEVNVPVIDSEITSFGIPIAKAASDITATSQAATLSSTVDVLPANWPLYVLAGVLILGILSVLLIPSKQGGDRVV